MSRTVLAIVEAHGRRDYPDECCGVLLGTGGVDDATVNEALDLPNVREDERRRRFVIGPRDYLGAERAARERGLSLLGFYHSHPDHPARPSEFDREHAWPNLHYIVLAVANGTPGDCTSWLLTEDRSLFVEEILRIS